MNTRLWFTPRRIRAALTLATVLLCGGCLEKRIIWSPDGSRAIVLTKQGELYLCDGEGRLTPPLAKEVKRAAWVGGARRLVFTRERQVTDWPTLAAALGTGRTLIEAQGQKALQQLLNGTAWPVIDSQLKKSDNAVKIWLRDLHGEEIQPKLSAEEWHGFRPGHSGVTITDVVSAEVEGDRLAVGPVLHTQMNEVMEIRPSPTGTALAWTSDLAESGDYSVLMLTTLAPTVAAPIEVARYVAAYPDWTADGRSLVYLETQPAPGGKHDGTIMLGVLCQRGVLDAQGRIALDEKPRYFAGGVFNSFAHIRCLKDGRILFNSPEMTFPMAAADYDGDHREQLFAVDPARQSTLVRLVPRGREADIPQALAFFEVSPDETQVVFGGQKSEVAVLTLATGQVEVVQEGADEQFQGLPSWRSAGELCYVRRAPVKDGVKQGRAAEVVLRRGDDTVVLSRTWSDAVIETVASQDRK